jgi:phosphoribosyl 1,2-cyclic phosphate phosphodiesterase
VEAAMDMLFLGTGAAEGVPAAYCRCDDCRGVRKRGGIEVKSRSSLRIGKHYQVDISPDHYWQMLRHDTDMFDLEHVLITHSHGDHFALDGLTDKTMAKVTNERPLNIYLSNPAKDYLEGTLEHMGISDDLRSRYQGRFSIFGLEYFSSYEIGELSVETVKSNHSAHGEDEAAISYLFTLPGGTKLLYALDTGYYTDETWEYLRGRQTDTLVMDCTFAGRTDRGEYPSGHLDMASFIRMLERMSESGFIGPRTRIYATHFNPHQGLTHHEIQEAFDKSAFTVSVAYDGLRFEA